MRSARDVRAQVEDDLRASQFPTHEMNLADVQAAYAQSVRSAATVLFWLLFFLILASVLNAVFDTSSVASNRNGRIISWSTGFFFLFGAALIARTYGIGKAAAAACAGFAIMIILSGFISGIGLSLAGMGSLTCLVVILGLFVSGRAATWGSFLIFIGLVALWVARSIGWIPGPTPQTMPPPSSQFIVLASGVIIIGALMRRFGNLFWRVATELDLGRQSLDQQVQQRTALLERTLEELVAADDERKLLLRRLHSQLEAERARFARDMHDQLGSSLTVLRRMTAQIARVSAATGGAPELAPKEVKVALDEIGSIAQSAQQVCDAAYTQTRRLIKAQGPELLEKTGLGDAIDDLVTEHRIAQPSCRFITIGLDAAGISQSWLRSDKARTTFRLVQEALTNASKHADATEVTVELRATQGGLLVRVADNGRGFRVATQPEGAHRRLGLASIRERTEALDGQLSVRSAPGEGTTIEAYIPIPDADQA